MHVTTTAFTAVLLLYTRHIAVILDRNITASSSFYCRSILFLIAMTWPGHIRTVKVLACNFTHQAIACVLFDLDLRLLVVGIGTLCCLSSCGTLSQHKLMLSVRECFYVCLSILRKTTVPAFHSLFCIDAYRYR